MKTLMQATDIATDRNEVIKVIRRNLQRRSGKQWSVTGGRGTAWGWITVDAPPSRRTWGHRLKPGMADYPENYEMVDIGKPDSCASPSDVAELAALLGLDGVHHQGISIPAGHDYYREYIERSEGKQPTKAGQQYWD